MRLVENAACVLRRAWSVRLLALSLAFSALEVAFPYLDGVLPVDRGAFGLLAGLTTIAAAVARFVAQDGVSGGRA